MLCGLPTGQQEECKMKKGIQVEAFYSKSNCYSNEKGKIQFNYEETSLPEEAKIFVGKNATYLQPQIELIKPNGIKETLFIQYTTDIDNVLETLYNGRTFKHKLMMFTHWKASNEKGERLFILVYFDDEKETVILKIEEESTLIVEFKQSSIDKIIKSLVV